MKDEETCMCHLPKEKKDILKKLIKEHRSDEIMKEVYKGRPCPVIIKSNSDSSRIGQSCGSPCMKDEETCMCHLVKEKKDILQKRIKEHRSDEIMKEVYKGRPCPVIITKSKFPSRIGQSCGSPCMKDEETCMCHLAKEKRDILLKRIKECRSLKEVAKGSPCPAIKSNSDPSSIENPCMKDETYMCHLSKEKKPIKDQIEKPQIEKPQIEKPQIEKPQIEKLQIEKPQIEKPQIEKPQVKSKIQFGAHLKLNLKPKKETTLFSFFILFLSFFTFYFSIPFSIPLKVESEVTYMYLLHHELLNSSYPSCPTSCL